MKLKLLVIAFTVAALALGFLFGRIQQRYSSSAELERLEKLSETERSARAAVAYLERIETSEANKACAGFSHAAGMLEAVRRGNTNEVIETLESDLDDNIGIIAAALLEVPAETRNPKYLSCVRWYRAYRTTHPGKDASTLSDQILSLLSTNQ